MGDQHQTTAVRGEPFLEELDGVEIEVVGRLVEDQHLVLTDQQPWPARRASPGHPTARRSTRRADGVIPNRSSIASPCHCPPTASRTDPDRQHRVLQQEPDPGPTTPPNLAGLGPKLAGEHPQQRALAAAVEPDDTEAITVADRHRDVGEQRSVRPAGGESFGVDEDHERSVLRKCNRQAPWGPGDSDGGPGRIRTSVGLCQLIYSQPPLATRVPTHLRESRLAAQLVSRHAQF